MDPEGLERGRTHRLFASPHDVQQRVHPGVHPRVQPNVQHGPDRPLPRSPLAPAAGSGQIRPVAAA